MTFTVLSLPNYQLIVFLAKTKYSIKNKTPKIIMDHSIKVPNGILILADIFYVKLRT